MFRCNSEVEGVVLGAHQGPTKTLVRTHGLDFVAAETGLALEPMLKAADRPNVGV